MTISIEVINEINGVNETASKINDDAEEVPDPNLLKIWAQSAYQKKTDAIASLLITNQQTIQQLNHQYRNKNQTTNVLSFSMQTPEIADVCLLGDIVLCARIINQEAENQSKSKRSHWAHMVIHGMLHLQGYNHIEKQEATIMESLEIELLKQHGFKNPYLI